MRWIQDQLNRRGATPPLIIDGQRGSATDAAILTFQAAHGLVADGVVGPATQAALRG